MKLDVRKLFDVSRYEELDHDAIREYYMYEPKKLHEDIKSCFKQISRIKGAPKEKWFKASGVLISKYCENISKRDIEKYRSLSDHFSKNNKNKDFLRFQKEIAEIIDCKLSNFCCINRTNSCPEKETIKFMNDGALICGEFISNRIIKVISDYALKKCKSKYSDKQLKNNALLKNIKELLEDYLKNKSKQRCTESTMKEYRLAVDRLEKFLDKNKVGFVDVGYEEANKFHEYIANNISKDRANNTVGYLYKLYNYFISRNIISKNPFSKETVMRYSVDISNKKRNFTLDELEKIFSGLYGIEKEILDYIRFTLHTGLRMEEFIRLDKDSFFERDDIKLIRVKTAKGKFGHTSEDEMVLHKNIHDLANYGWIKKIKSMCKTKNALEHRVNRAIDKVVEDKDVSAHRLRGTFAQIISAYDAHAGIGESMPNIALALRHVPSGSKFMGNKQEQLSNATKLMLRKDKSNSILIYSQDSAIMTQVHILKAFDGISGIFEYLNMGNLTQLKAKIIKHEQRNKKITNHTYINTASTPCFGVI